MTTATITILRDDDGPRPAGLVWETPPDTRTKPGKYAAIARALRDHPGEWAILRTYPTGSRRGWGFAGAIRQGKLADLRSGYEAVARTVDGQIRVYVRYAPPSALAATS
ncbi:MAG: hypothetical protein ACRDP1_12200 [Nocardioidaceae bacterium]